MSSSEFQLADQAEKLLAATFARLGDPTKKLAAFRTPSGRQLALQLERKGDIYVWAECFDGQIEGVAINNSKRPGMPYAADQARGSGVNSRCSRLQVGNVAYSLRCDTLGSLERFARWYEGA